MVQKNHGLGQRPISYHKKVGDTLKENSITAAELKKINRNRIFKLIYERKEISRRDIALALSLSQPTVTQNLQELEDMGLIDYAGNFQSTGGRKAQAIIPKTDARITIGIEISKSYIRILAIDLAGKVLDYEKYIKTFSIEEEYGRNLSYLISNMIGHNRLKQEHILGVGLAVAAVFDQQKECIIKAPSLEVSGYAIENLVKFIDYPYSIDNDANAGAFVELWEHLQGESRVYLAIGKGVGGCLIRNNEIVRGVHHRAGEFGHMTLFPNGRMCNCGQKGCLEAYLSIERLSDDLNCQVEDFFSELAAGNPKHMRIWEEYKQYLCIGINNIYMAYDEEIVLGGVLSQYLEPYMQDICHTLAALNSFEPNGDYLTLTKHHSRVMAVGAALQLVSHFIDGI